MTEVDALNDPHIAKRQAYKAAYEQTEYDLTELIDPSDVIEGAKRWSDISDERLNQEVHESTEVMCTEDQLGHIEHDLAVSLLRDSLKRAKKEHLAFDSEEEMVKAGFWPNRMTKWEVSDIIEEVGLDELDPMHETRDEAAEIVYSWGAFDAMHPRRDKDVDRRF